MAAAIPCLHLPRSSSSSSLYRGRLFSCSIPSPVKLGFGSSPTLPPRSLGIYPHSRSLRPVLARDSPPGGGSGGGGGLGGGDGGENGDSGRNSSPEASLVLAMAGQTESLHAAASSKIKDLAAMIERAKLLIFQGLPNFSGLKERVLADDLFLAEVVMECVVGIITEAAAELERQKGYFMKGLGFSIAGVVKSTPADSMLVRLPASTVSLQALLQLNAGPISRFHVGLSMTYLKVSQDMKLQDHNGVLSRMVLLSSLVDLSILETDAGTRTPWFVSAGAAIAVGAAVAVVGLLGYHAYATRKGSSD